MLNTYSMESSLLGAGGDPWLTPWQREVERASYGDDSGGAKWGVCVTAGQGDGGGGQLHRAGVQGGQQEFVGKVR